MYHTYLIILYKSPFVKGLERFCVEENMQVNARRVQNARCRVKEYIVRAIHESPVKNKRIFVFKFQPVGRERSMVATA